MKRHIVQVTSNDPIPEPRLHRVDYQRLCRTLHFPLLWVYEPHLEAWLPREVDQECCDILLSGRLTENFSRRLELLGMAEDAIEPKERLKHDFLSTGMVVVKHLLPKGYCKQLVDYYRRRPEVQDRWQDLPGIKRTSVNNSPLMRLVHQSTEGFVRHIVGDVKTSYSFTSAYEAGSTLPAHTDRPQCAFNASVILGVDPLDADPREWPLWIETRIGVRAAKLEVGDAVLYSGVKDKHWRDALPESVHGLLGAFFHYVPADFTGSLD